MEKKEIRKWKKVYQSDLSHLVAEFMDSVEEPCTIILEGDLGAGKTTFVKECLDSSKEVLSPSYSLLMEYGDILHGDFYRLKSEEELIELEIPLYLENKNIFMVEWGKKFVYRLEKEIPDNFSFYLLEIDFIKPDELGKERRNYTLYGVEFL